MDFQKCVEKGVMSGFPFPTPTHKWMGIPEAKHPLIQDLIKLWEESPGYILPQQSFIKDRPKLEAFIDALVEVQKQKALMPAKVAIAKPAVSAAANNIEAASKGEDPNWEKNLASALAMSKVNTTNKANAPMPAPLALPADLAIDPKLQGKLAELKRLEPLPMAVPQTETPRTKNIHLIILYAVSLSAFVLACIALKR